MVICKTVDSLREYLTSLSSRANIGFIPTMGALHDGHASLMRAAKDKGQFTVVSIFVNPTQFNDPSDFSKYPKTLPEDILLLERTGVDVLFLPSVEEVYPHGTQLQEHYDLGYLETILEGKYRPGHFQGVCQVVERLLRLVAPQKLYLGQKDYQQCMVLRKMIDLKQLPVELIIVPTRRETDGLAMSSRNMRLDDVQRKGAVALFQALEEVKHNILKKTNPSFPTITLDAQHELESKGFKVDYVSVARASDLQSVDHWDGHTPLVALVAAFTGEVRLIDNELIKLP
jgi:pantoate--beta-alanine ligase